MNLRSNPNKPLVHPSLLTVHCSVARIMARNLQAIEAGTNNYLQGIENAMAT